MPRGLGIPWNLAALALTLGVFAYPFSRRKTPELNGLFVTALCGVLLVAGSRTLPGLVFYQLALKKTLPILFAAFSNTTRWLPLVILPCPVALAPLQYYQLWHARSQHSSAARWLRERTRDAIAGLQLQPTTPLSPLS